MCCETVKCTTSHWMKDKDVGIHLVYQPALEYSLPSRRPLAELPLVSSLHFSSSLVPHSRPCFHVGWASPPHSPSDDCCSWTLLFLHQGRCPVATGCQSSQCPGETYSNHWKMVLCRETFFNNKVLCKSSIHWNLTSSVANETQHIWAISDWEYFLI